MHAVRIHIRYAMCLPFLLFFYAHNQLAAYERICSYKGLPLMGPLKFDRRPDKAVEQGCGFVGRDLGRVGLRPDIERMDGLRQLNGIQ